MLFGYQLRTILLSLPIFSSLPPMSRKKSRKQNNIVSTDVTMLICKEYLCISRWRSAFTEKEPNQEND